MKSISAILKYLYFTCIIFCSLIYAVFPTLYNFVLLFKQKKFTFDLRDKYENIKQFEVYNEKPFKAVLVNFFILKEISKFLL